MISAACVLRLSLILLLSSSLSSVAVAQQCTSGTALTILGNLISCAVTADCPQPTYQCLDSTTIGVRLCCQTGNIGGNIGSAVATCPNNGVAYIDPVTLVPQTCVIGAGTCPQTTFRCTPSTVQGINVCCQSNVGTSGANCMAPSTPQTSPATGLPLDCTLTSTICTFPATCSLSTVVGVNVCCIPQQGSTTTSGANCIAPSRPQITPLTNSVTECTLTNSCQFPYVCSASTVANVRVCCDNTAANIGASGIQCPAGLFPVNNLGTTTPMLCALPAGGCPNPAVCVATNVPGTFACCSATQQIGLGLGQNPLQNWLPGFQSGTGTCSSLVVCPGTTLPRRCCVGNMNYWATCPVGSTCIADYSYYSAYNGVCCYTSGINNLGLGTGNLGLTGTSLFGGFSPFNWQSSGIFAVRSSRDKKLIGQDASQVTEQQQTQPQSQTQAKNGFICPGNQTPQYYPNTRAVIRCETFGQPQKKCDGSNFYCFHTPYANINVCCSGQAPMSYVEAMKLFYNKQPSSPASQNTAANNVYAINTQKKQRRSGAITSNFVFGVLGKSPSAWIRNSNRRVAKRRL